MQYNNFHDEPNNKSAVSSAPFWLMGLVSIISVITSIITAVNLPGFLTWVSVGIAAISTIAWFCVASLCNFVNNLANKFDQLHADSTSPKLASSENNKNLSSAKQKSSRNKKHLQNLNDELEEKIIALSKAKDETHIWVCPNCLAFYQTKNSTCNNCNASTEKATDWQCPQCGNIVHKNKEECPECHYELTDVNKNIKSSSQS